MSWDIDLIDDRGHVEISQNYTHNCNAMANAVLMPGTLDQAAIRWWRKHNREDVVERILTEDKQWGSWWQVLDGMEGPAGAEFLHRIINQLEAEPERFRAMQPDNGWGSYDSFLEVLKKLRNAVPEWPTTWSASG